MDVRQAHEIDAINLPAHTACLEVKRVMAVAGARRSREVVGVMVVRVDRALCADVIRPAADVRAVRPCAINVLRGRPRPGRGVATVEQRLTLDVRERDALVVVA
jgi:hypothetical protein